MIRPRLPIRPFAIASFLLATMFTGSAQQPSGSPGQSQDPRSLTVRQASSGVAPDGRGQLWAVVVGISSYKNVPPEGQLRFAHRDAEDLAAFLRSPGGGGFPSSHVKLLLNQEATLAAIRTAIGTWLVRSVEADDVVYIFFAGHGVVEGDSDGYLLAHDSDPQNLYATALPTSELDRIITGRLHARIVVLMADACHSGQIGWASRGTTERALITNYLDEVGKSGAGVLRLLASRADERSFEDNRWGGGHGAFTFFLLEALRGKADRDKDGFVRAGELLNYISEIVPEETKALQHPRMAGSIDPRLPLSILGREAVLGREKPVEPSVKSTAATICQLEVRGPAGSEVYVDNVYRGRIRPSGLLIIEQLSPGQHQVSVDAPGAATSSRTVSLTAANTVLDLKPPTGLPKPSPALGGFKSSPPKASPAPTVVSAPAPAKTSPLVAEITTAMSRNQVLEPNGAWTLYKQLVRETPNEPQRTNIEITMSSALEEIGQQAINNYVSASVLQLRSADFKRGAQAFSCLRTLDPKDAQLEPKQLFCEARVAIDESKTNEAIAALKRAIELDPRAGYLYNALGVAYEIDKDNDKAHDAFKRAAELAPQWSFPRLHLGIQYQVRGKMERAEDEFQAAVRLDPRDPFTRWWLVRHYRERGRLQDAEKTALELIRLSPKFASVYAELGIIYEAAHQYGRAADSYENYLRLAPTAADARFTRYDVGKIQEAATRTRREAEKKEPRLKKS
ncbi:MAG TPA: tetratricopeptide repeat protein [Blastocatellia bacterium]|nr:tetratricopeptide repeat protein [Blastocatellia bacterium]